MMSVLMKETPENPLPPPGGDTEREASMKQEVASTDMGSAGALTLGSSF